MGRVVCRAAIAAVICVVVSGSRLAAQARPAAVPDEIWSLESVLTAALAQHPLVEAARAEVTAVEGRRRAAAATPNPVATYWVENARFPGQGARPGLEPEISAYATMPLEPFIQRGARVASADGDVRVARAAVVSIERRVATDVVHAFFRVALAQASRDAAGENQRAIGELVEYLRNRVAQGATAEGELIRAEVERDRTATETALSEAELARASATLRSYVGDRSPLGTIRVDPPSWTTSRPPLAPLSQFTTHALETRPELTSSRARVDAANGAISLERSLLIRQLGATFGVKRTLGMSSMVAGLSLTVPIFDRNRGDIQRATGEHQVAEQQSRWIERTVITEVDGEYQAALALVPRLAALQPSFIQRAEESRRIALAAYQEGATGLLQVLDASRALSDVRLTCARAAAAASESLFSLAVSSGYDVAAAVEFSRSGTFTASVSPAPGGSR